MKPTILCVDDSEQEHTTYQRELSGDYNVLKAMNGQEALKHLRSGASIS